MARGQYDDAWETPGWTAQNMAYPPSDEGTDYVPPLGVTAVLVTGTYKGSGGRPASGAVTFTPSIRLLNVEGQQVTVHKVMARLDSYGKVAVRLPVIPGPWHVRQRVGTDIKEFNVVLAADVDLSSLVSADSVVSDDDFPIEADLTIYTGTTWREHFQWISEGVPKDLSAYTARFETTAGDADIVLTQGTGITLSNTGDIDLLMSSTATTGLPEGVYPYRLTLTQPGGDTTRLVEGKLTVT